MTKIPFGIADDKDLPPLVGGISILRSNADSILENQHTNSIEMKPIITTSSVESDRTTSAIIEKRKYKQIAHNDTKEDNATNNKRLPTNSKNVVYTSYDTDRSFYRYLLSKSLYDWFFPPNIPRSCQLLRVENMAIPASYLLVGVLQGLSGPFINVYPLDLNATEAQQTTITGLRTLPASLKLVFGFVSDNLPLMGYRRKSYMLIGWLITSLSMVMLVTLADLSIVKEESRTPTIPFLSFTVLLFGIGFWFADVMADSVIAEKAKLEPEETRGHLQSTCYACRFFGLMVAAPCSTFLYSHYGPQLVVNIMATLPVLILPLVYLLGEQYDMKTKGTIEHCQEIWNTVCSRAVWQPMGFLYLYNIMQVSNAAWRQFLRTALGFTSNQLNSLLVVSYVLLYLGIMSYKYYFITWSWRNIYILTTLLGGVFSALQLCLISGWTLGLSPFWFALGDDSFVEFIVGIQFLPLTIMMVHLCPSGSEGASYAMFTTVSNSAGTLAAAISTMMLGIWDVSKESMAVGNLTGMMKLTILTTSIQTSAVLFVGLLPKYKEDLMTLNESAYSGSRIGGFLFLLITFLSILYTIIVGILNIVNPGWAGET